MKCKTCNGSGMIAHWDGSAQAGEICPDDSHDGPTYLECPCCGDDGAISNHAGEFFDGQVLMCGCSGHVSVDGESEPWINNGDTPCPATAKCQTLLCENCGLAVCECRTGNEGEL